MNLLISKEKVAALLQVAIGYDVTNFNSFIDQAQEFDLKPLVCEDFFYDLLAKKADEPYKKLIEGGTYDHNGRQYEFKGIEGVLAYFSYARYFLESPAVATSHGIVTRTTPNSTPVELQERRNTYYKKREQAMSLWQDVNNYINRHSTDFPSWICTTGCGTEKPRGGFNTKVIQ